MFKLSELIKKSSYLPKETAKILGVSTNTLIRYADTDKLQCFTSDKGYCASLFYNYLLYHNFNKSK